MSAPGFYSLLLWQRLDDALTWAEFQTQTLEKTQKRWRCIDGLCLFGIGGMSLARKEAQAVLSLRCLTHHFLISTSFAECMPWLEVLETAQIRGVFAIAASSQPGLFPRYIYPGEWLMFMVNVGKYTSPWDPMGLWMLGGNFMSSLRTFTKLNILGTNMFEKVPKSLMKSWYATVATDVFFC